MDEKEKEKEKQLPSWNRRGVAQRRGGRFKDNHFDLTTTPALRATPPDPGCGVQIRKEERPEKGLNLCIRSSKRPSFEIKEEESAP